MADKEVTDLTLGIYRRIYSGFLTGRRINSISVDAEALFWRLHAVADDFGNLPLSPTILKGIAAPMRGWTTTDIERLVGELLASTLILPYEVNHDTFGHIEGWETRQPANRNGRRIKRWPLNPNEMGNPGESGCSLGNRVPPIPIPTPIPISKPPSATPTERVPAEAVEAIYQAYPKHVGKQEAIKAIPRAVKQIAAARGLPLLQASDWLMDRVVAFAGSRMVATTDPQYIKAPAAWMNAGRYDDDESLWSRAHLNGSASPPKPEPKLAEGLH